MSVFIEDVFMGVGCLNKDRSSKLVAAKMKISIVGDRSFFLIGNEDGENSVSVSISLSRADAYGLAGFFLANFPEKKIMNGFQS